LVSSGITIGKLWFSLRQRILFSVGLPNKASWTSARMMHWTLGSPSAHALGVGDGRSGLLPRPIVGIFKYFLVVEPVETLASSFFCSQAESTPAPAPVSPSPFGDLRRGRCRNPLGNPVQNIVIFSHTLSSRKCRTKPNKELKS